MKVLPCNQPTFFDVDDTLVLWFRGKAGDPGVVEIECPTSRYSEAYLELIKGDAQRCFDPENPIFTERHEEVIHNAGKWTEYLIPHEKHIEQLKLHKLRGHTIVVWSAGGWEWALAVVRALKLEQYVDLVISKPTWCYDDKKPEEYMPKSSYVNYEIK